MKPVVEVWPIEPRPPVERTWGAQSDTHYHLIDVIVEERASGHAPPWLSFFFRGDGPIVAEEFVGMTKRPLAQLGLLILEVRVLTEVEEAAYHAAEPNREEEG